MSLGLYPSVSYNIYKYLFYSEVNSIKMGALEIDSYSTKINEFIIKCRGCAILDGGLRTELEARGADLKNPLWSANFLITAPELIREVYFTVWIQIIIYLFAEMVN